MFDGNTEKPVDYFILCRADDDIIILRQDDADWNGDIKRIVVDGVLHIILDRRIDHDELHVIILLKSRAFVDIDGVE